LGKSKLKSAEADYIRLTGDVQAIFSGVATSRESHRFGHADWARLPVLTSLRLRTLYGAENIGSAFK
jgi:hypothetical protein